MDLLIVFIFMIAILASFLTLEAKSREISLLALVLATSAFGFAFIRVGAFYVGVFQLLIYSGVLTVLFASSAYFMELDQEEEEKLNEVGEPNKGGNNNE